jgi:hypothetical protein
VWRACDASLQQSQHCFSRVCSVSGIVRQIKSTTCSISRGDGVCCHSTWDGELFGDAKGRLPHWWCEKMQGTRFFFVWLSRIQSCREAFDDPHSKNRRGNPSCLIQIGNGGKTVPFGAKYIEQRKNILIDCGKTFRDSLLRFFPQVSCKMSLFGDSSSKCRVFME